MAELSPQNQAKASHWIDLHHMTCQNPDCELCTDKEVRDWNWYEELAYFEAADTSLPPMPKKGDRVYIRCGDAVLSGHVIHLYNNIDQFMVNTLVGHHVCTQYDLASPEEACDG